MPVTTWATVANSITSWGNALSQGTSANWLNQGTAIWAGNLDTWQTDPTYTVWAAVA